MLQFFTGGSGLYTGIASDGNNGLIAQGRIKALQGIININGVITASPLDIPTGAQTNIGPYGTVSHTGLEFILVSVGGVGGMGFAPPITATYGHCFSIPIVAGTTGGDILVEAVIDGSTYDSWTFTLGANQKTVLSGLQFDRFGPTDTVFYALTQSSGSTWSVLADPLVFVSLF